ncbi:MAG: hypothetical protein ACK5MV_10590 [Aminipila sp.]
MGTKTKNYNLTKPNDNDVVDINIFNENSDIIDNELNKNKEDISVVNNNLTTEITNRQTAILTEQTARANADTTLLELINSKGSTATEINISEDLRVLLGLSVDNANVDKTLQKIMQGGLLNALLTGFNNNGSSGSIAPTDSLLTALCKLSNTLKIATGIIILGDYAVTNTVTADLSFSPTIVFATSSDSCNFVINNNTKRRMDIGASGSNYELYATLNNQILALEYRKYTNKQVYYLAIKY